MRTIAGLLPCALLWVLLCACGAEEPASPAAGGDAASSTLPETASPYGVATAGPAPAPARLRRVAEEFLAFARGEAVAPRLGEEVALLLGNTRVAIRAGRALRDRRAWSVCPRDGYAERSCPLSATRSFGGPDLGRPVFTAEVPEEPCTHGPQLPPSLRSVGFVTVLVEERYSCLDYLAVQLFVDDGLIVAANLVLGSP